ncbi:MAG: hypothetical protein K2N67_05240 [Mucispirillum sp.]|nr:hypothetical protein [Mucispirillum sp.]
MDKIYISAICALILIIIITGIYIAVRIGIDNKRINILEEEKTALLLRINSAEALLSVQNERIASHAVDMKQAEAVYAGKLADIEKKYDSLKRANIKDGASCESELHAIYENQARFCNESVIR